MKTRRYTGKDVEAVEAGLAVLAAEKAKVPATEQLTAKVAFPSDAVVSESGVTTQLGSVLVRTTCVPERGGPLSAITVNTLIASFSSCIGLTGEG